MKACSKNLKSILILDMMANISMEYAGRQVLSYSLAPTLLSNSIISVCSPCNACINAVFSLIFEESIAVHDNNPPCPFIMIEQAASHDIDYTLLWGCYTQRNECCILGGLQTARDQCGPASIKKQKILPPAPTA